MNDSAENSRSAEIVIIGAGAAGLMTAIHAGRTFPHKKILLIDSAKKPGAKILVENGWSKEYRNELQVSTGKFGKITIKE